MTVQANDVPSQYPCRSEVGDVGYRGLVGNSAPEVETGGIDDHRNAYMASHQDLPHEILGYIFTLVDYEPYGHFDTQTPKQKGGRLVSNSIVTPCQWKSRSPFNVSGVSRRWRNIAHTTPQLWSSLVVDTQKGEHCKMMKYWFKHAKAVPVRVTLWQEELWAEKHSALERMWDNQSVRKIVESIVSVIGFHIHQVESLRVCCESEPEPFIYPSSNFGSQDLSIIFKALEGLKYYPSQSLKELVIDSMDGTLQRTQECSLLPTFPFPLFGNLRTLHVRGFLPAKTFFFDIPFGLTILKLDAPSYSGSEELPEAREHYVDLLNLLSSLPQLERLRLKGKYPAIPSSDLLPNEFIQLPRLKTLTLVGYPCATYASQLHAPNLTKFKLKGEDYSSIQLPENEQDSLLHWEGVEPIVADFLKRSGARIMDLSIQRVGSSLERFGLASWLKRTTFLKRLVLVQRPELLHAASILLTTKYQQGGWMFCRKLEMLELDSTDPTGMANLDGLVGREGMMITRRLGYAKRAKKF